MKEREEEDQFTEPRELRIERHAEFNAAAVHDNGVNILMFVVSGQTKPVLLGKAGERTSFWAFVLGVWLKNEEEPVEIKCCRLLNFQGESFAFTVRVHVVASFRVIIF